MSYLASPDFQSRRSMVIAKRGMVATSHPLAAQAGLAILREGGNAADAAIATAAVLAVVEPASTGIGGDCFALFYDAATREVTGLNGSGRAPAALTPDLFGGAATIPERHPLAVTVAGAVRGWEDLLAKHGRMSLKKVLADAIHYALEGYPVSPMFGAAWQSLESLLKNSPHTEDYLPVPKIGELKTLPSLGRTLQAIAEGGADAFYGGKTAQAIVSTLEALGGVMSLEDLKNHTSSWVKPIFTDYRGVRIFEIPPNGQGLAALQALNILEGFDLGKWDDPARLHLMIEAMRLAFADAGQYIADPDLNPAPVAALLGKTYAAERRQLISPIEAMQPPAFGLPPASSDTVYLTVVDGEGNACSFINSLYMGFGSGIVAKGTGVFLQNRGANFSLNPHHPNVVAPNKRPYHTIIPALASQNGELWASFGVMGGFMQPQGHVQVLTAMLDDRLDPQAALDRPRWMVMDDSQIALEEGIPISAMARLAEMGHPVQPITGFRRAIFGSGQIIRHQDGVYYGGSDPRKDGLVAAF